MTALANSCTRRKIFIYCRTVIDTSLTYMIVPEKLSTPSRMQFTLSHTKTQCCNQPRCTRGYQLICTVTDIPVQTYSSIMKQKILLYQLAFICRHECLIQAETCIKHTHASVCCVKPDTHLHQKSWSAPFNTPY